MIEKEAKLVKLLHKFILIIFFTSLTSCMNKYKNSWDCPKVKGIGCSSIEYADSAAKDEIILSQFKQDEIEVLINTDILKSNYKKIRIK